MKPDAETIYRALKASKRLGSLRRLRYVCHTERCLLLEAVQVPELGLLIYRRGPRYSPAMNEAKTAPELRESSTRDGDRRWTPDYMWGDQTSLAQPEWSEGGLEVSCNHVLAYTITSRHFEEDRTAGRAEVAVRPDHSRAVLK